MLNIILCEDNIKFRDNVVSFLKSYIQVNKIDANIELVTDKPKVVLDYQRKNMGKTNIYFFDIALGSNADGLMLAKEIRKQDNSSYIVFITSFQDLSIKTFQYKLRVSDYIYKGEKNLKDRLRDCMEMIIQDYIRSTEYSSKTITVKSGQTIYTIPQKDIISIQTSASEHKIVVCTLNNQIEFYGTMKDIEDELDETFFKVHRSYIINIKYLKSINKNREDMHVLMKDGSKCLLSRNYVKGLVEYVELSSDIS